MKAKELSPIVYCCSYILLLTSVIILIPLIFSLFEKTPVDEEVFIGMSVICFILGRVGVKYNRESLSNVSSLQLYLITTSCWMLFGMLGAVPFVLGLSHLSFTDAAFESFSGITTTGSTILPDIEKLPPSILIWRGLLQWIGGIGIIVLSIAILPYLRIGGMRLFSTESSDWTAKTHPRAKKMVFSILYVYIFLSITCALFYYFLGMSFFDAIVHAMTTLSTGGYSNYNSSFGHFSDNASLMWTASVFMVLASLPFVFYVNVISQRGTYSLFDSQIKGFLIFLLIMITVLSLERIFNSDMPVLQSIEHVAFNVISVVTTTGYASSDYTSWSQFSIMLFFYLMFIGGCSGSTSGSMKFFRFQLAYLMLKNQLKQMVHPNAVFALKYNDRIISDDIIRSVVAFSMLFALVIAIIAAILALSGLDFVTSITAASTAVTNVGPGLGEIIGPSGNFASLPDHVKWVLSFGMLLGRLEIMTILVLLTPTIWNK